MKYPKKLKLSELSLKSFITSQSDQAQSTLKSGNIDAHYDSDGPPLTTSGWTELVGCISSDIKNTCYISDKK